MNTNPCNCWVHSSYALIALFVVMLTTIISACLVGISWLVLIPFSLGLITIITYGGLYWYLHEFNGNKRIQNKRHNPIFAWLFKTNNS